MLQIAKTFNKATIDLKNLIHSLIRTRDSLLFKFMSGEIDV